MPRVNLSLANKEHFSTDIELFSYVATPLLRASTESDAMQREIAKTAVGRIAEMEEIGDAIAFLVSPMSSYMNGAALIVDG